MDLEAVKAYNRCHLRSDEAGKQAALERLGNPSKDALIELAHEGLADSDRNVRFQMIRLVSAQGGPRASEAILRGLNDSARRVRKLAAKLSMPFAGNAEVERRLRELAEDEGEIRKVRGAAFGALSSGKFLSSLATSPAEARKFFEDVPELARYRKMALDVLVSLDPLGHDAEEILRYVIETGTKEEAVAATRALCGFKVVNLAAVPPAERRRVAQTHELAQARVYYWVPRTKE